MERTFTFLRKVTFLWVIFIMPIVFVNGQSGVVRWERFKTYTGTLADLAKAENPDSVLLLNTTQAPSGIGDNYYARMTGFIKPDVTGDYVFYIASDDNSDLYLSTDQDPANVTVVCSVTAWSPQNNFTQNASQKSVSINLKAGFYYYFQALMREGGGGDHLSIAWTKPGEAANSINVITSEYITLSSNNPPTASVIAKPKPVLLGAGAQKLVIKGINDGNADRVEVISVTAISSDEAIVNGVTVDYTSPRDSATINYALAGAAGLAEITVTIKDNEGGTDTYTTSFIVEVRDPVKNDPPFFGEPTNKTVYLDRVKEYVLLSNVDDGDDNEDQGITFTVESLNSTILEAVKVSYTKGEKYAMLELIPKNAGTAQIKITATDDGGTANGGKNLFERTITFTISGYLLPGISFEYYDVQHWQSLEDNATAVPGSYQIIQSAQSPIENLAKDFFWQRMWGYLKPQVTGEYMFQTRADGDNSAFLFLSTDANPANKTQIATHGVESAPIVLTAGKTYYWMAKSADIVNPQPFWVKVAEPEKSFEFVTGKLSSPIFDTTPPTQPINLAIKTKGVSDVLLTWTKSTDKNLLGYFVYVDGVKQSDTITTTSYLVKGLSPLTAYSVLVRAYDKYENGSIFSNTVNFTTYAIDNVAPSVPTGLSLGAAYDLGLLLKWNASTDAQTEIRGYNIYVNGSTEPYNKEIIFENQVLVTGLNRLTQYSFTVEAVDANYNKSAKTAAFNASTTDFNPDVLISGYKKGRVQLSMEAIATSEGFSLNGSYGASGVLSRNKLDYPGFEQDDKNAAKSISTTLVYTILNKTSSPTDIYAGNKSARISGANGDYLRCNLSSYIDGDLFDYQLKFAVKKSASYAGTLKVRITDVWGGNEILNKDFAVGTDWSVITEDIKPTYKGVERGWRIDFILSGSGYIYLDEITWQFKDDEYYENSVLTPFSKKGIELAKEFAPNGLRWGAINANFEKFSDHSGYRRNDFTYADWVALSNTLNAKSIITTGIYQEYDWYTDASIMTKFMDYIGGDASTVYGKKRIDEEGYTDLLTKSPGLVIEFGNEVWGGGCLLTESCGTNHGNIQWEAKPADYGLWCRTSATKLKASTGYTNFKDKIRTCYSGGTTDLTSFGNWSPLSYTGDKGEVDWLAIMGYMGGNLSYTPEIPRGQSELDYHKNTMSNLNGYYDGIFKIQKDMLAKLGRILPMYMYEGNMTRDDYNARLGQAINFTDFYAGAIERGVAAPAVFAFEGGQWRLLEDKTFKKLPLFYTSAYFNKYCKGDVLKTKFLSMDTLTTEKGTKLALDAVSTHAYAKGENYTIMLLSRDFENDVMVQVELPDSIQPKAGYKIFTLSGDAFQSYDTKIDSMASAAGKVDSMVVRVPKYGMVIITFKANAYSLNAPKEGVLKVKKVTDINVVIDKGTNPITVAAGELVCHAEVVPADAFSNLTSYAYISNTANATTSTTVARAKDRGWNGEVVIRFTALDGSNFYKDYVVVIDIPGNKPPIGFDKNEAALITAYPNPFDHSINFIMPQGEEGIIEIVDAKGILQLSKKAETEIVEINTSELPSGLYYVNIKLNGGVKTIKLVKP